MSENQLESLLSGVIIFLLIMAMWKWYTKSFAYGSNSMILPCGCPYGRCRCSMYEQRYRNRYEGLAGDQIEPRQGPDHVTGSGPLPPITKSLSQDYSGDAIKEMSLETEVDDSHQRWCDQLSFAGLPTGASSCTTLEETGRSYGTADFVGLTARKFCKARQLAVPAPDARFTPSQNIVEWCDMPSDSLI